MTETLTEAKAVTTDPSEVPQFFSISQRIGRMRYLVYTLSGMIGCSSALLMIYFFCLVLPQDLGKLIFEVSLIVIKNILMPMVVFVMTVRRLHDINFNGWWAILVLVPFLATILLIVPGNSASNRFGPIPRDNSSALKVAAILIPLCLFVLFFALRNAPSGLAEPPRTDKGLPTYPQ